MIVKYIKRPQIEESTLIAAWPGMGMLAVIAAQYLKTQLKAEPFAEIYSPLNSVSFKNGLLQSSHITNRLYYRNNLIFCIGDSQPLTAHEVFNLAKQILQFGKEFNVKRVYTTAASLSPFEGEPQVFGIANKEDLIPFLKEWDISTSKGEGNITGLNGVLLGVAAEMEIEGICLLGQIRFMDIPQPGSAIAVLKILTKILNITIDFSDLNKEAKRIEESIKESLSRYPTRKGQEKGLDYIG